MRIRELRKGRLLDSELKKMAREQLRRDPAGYWDFLGDIREKITEAQMTMLIDYQDELRSYKAP
jgi:hypothetical protein